MQKKNKICNGLTFYDCELAILRMAVDKAEEKLGKRAVHSSDVQKIINIVEIFIKQKNLICYGGTAINNILPEDQQFYNKEVEIPDYDFFSKNALDDAKELADIYFKNGFTAVEAKSGQHEGTYKVFVNYMAIADITYLPKEIYTLLNIDAISVDGILYAPPNFLRMSMYLELSRPAGDISRWEKVLKRLTLLNKNYPITDVDCNKVTFQRDMNNKANKEEIYEIIKSTLIRQGVVFFGGYANVLYSQYMPKHLQHKIQNVADFDVLSNTPDVTAKIIKERLHEAGIKQVKIIKHIPIGDIIPEHYEIIVGKDTVLFIYKPIGCHSYNILKKNGQKIKVATIDTMLSFYLAFLYANKPYYNQFIDRILCMSKFLFDVQQKNRLEQNGLLQRFSIVCYGHQETVEEIRAEKSFKYKELKQSKNKKQFEEMFLNYNPSNSNVENNTNEIKKPNKPTKSTKSTKKTKKRNMNRSYFNIYGFKRSRKNKR